MKKAIVASALVHALLIGAIVVGEAMFTARKNKPTGIVFIPAAPLGELPRGNAVGIGEAPRGNAPSPAPPQRTAQPTRATPPPTIPANRATQPVTRALPQTTPTRPTTQQTSSRPTQSGSSVNEIRQRLLAGMQTNGTGVGARGTPSGGGTGGGRTGDPNGSSVGVLGGSGQGTPFWDYYLHLHDALYAAWAQPSQFADPLRPPTARVRLRIAKDGSLWAAELAQSSGIREVDDSALSAARSARLNPPPAAMLAGKDFCEVTVAFKVGGEG